MIDEQAHLSLLVRQSRSNLEAQTALKVRDLATVLHGDDVVVFCHRRDGGELRAVAVETGVLDHAEQRAELAQTVRR